MAQQYKVMNARTGAVLADDVAVAHDSQSRRKGWLGIESAPDGAGIWIAPCEAVHCFFMKFTIDVLFLDRDKRVIRCLPALRPWRIAVCVRASSVLELPEGKIESTGTRAGDQLVVEKIG